MLVENPGANKLEEKLNEKLAPGFKILIEDGFNTPDDKIVYWIKAGCSVVIMFEDGATHD